MTTKNRKSSQMWRYFKELDSSFAHCNMCSAKLSYKTSTTNLKKHLKKKHPAAFTGMPSKDEVTMTADDNTLQYVETEELVEDQDENPNEEKLESNRMSTTESKRVPKITIHDILTKSTKKNEETDVNSVVINLRVPSGNSLPQDEFCAFGEHVSNELRSLKDPKYALVLAEVKRKINTILNEAEVQCLRLDAQQTSSPIQIAYEIQMPVSPSHLKTKIVAKQTSDG